MGVPFVNAVSYVFVFGTDIDNERVNSNAGSPCEELYHQGPSAGNGTDNHRRNDITGITSTP